MHAFDLVALLITLAALFAYANYRFFRLPTTIGVMLISVVASLALVGISAISGVSVHKHLAAVVNRIDLNAVVLHGMLGLLLFAGALHLNLSDLKAERGAVLALATAGTLISACIAGGLFYWVLGALGVGLPLIWCLLFGALISPTDPISVLGIMKSVNAPKTLETLVSGESLFNDGVAVVAFLVLLDVLEGQTTLSVHGVGLLLVRETLGGVLMGLAAGALTYRLLRGVDNYQVEVLLTLALATGVYALSERIHVSAPLAVVVAGIFIGNRGRKFAMSPSTRQHVDSFWEMVDEILNAVLFLLIGLELLVLPYRKDHWIFCLAAVVITLAARWISVGGIISVMRLFRPFHCRSISVLTWGGLRGAISVAMALALPQHDAHRSAIVSATYAVVVFSVIAQGLTIGPLVRHAMRAEAKA